MVTWFRRITMWTDLKEKKIENQVHKFFCTKKKIFFFGLNHLKRRKNRFQWGGPNLRRGGWGGEGLRGGKVKIV